MTPLDERLRCAAQAIQDDIRGVFKGGPEYKKYLADLMVEAVADLERMRAERLKLDRRIHNQRMANRDTWETVEMRRKWMGSDVMRRAYAALLKRYQALLFGRHHPGPPA